MSPLASPDSARAVVGKAYVLDDEPQIGAIVCQLLAAAGFDPHSFTDPKPFLSRLNTSHPELVCLDLALGKSDAVEVIHQLEILQYKGKVLLISGRDEGILAEVQHIGTSHGLAMLPSLPKPFRANDLKVRLGADVVKKKTPAETKESDAKLVSVDLGEALQNRWLELWYQPKIDLKSLSVCGAEALLRARHPEHGIICPAELLPPAGDPLYQPVSKFVIQQALADWEWFASQGKSLKLAVNIPVSVMHAPDFIKVVRDALPKDPNFPGLIFEITEDEVLRDSETVREIATQLKLYNVRLSIDDFGTVYSSLSRLSDLPCVELKLDRRFVLGCSMDSAKQSICVAAIELAHGYGLTVCAEGVENAEDLRTLMEIGCHTAQGFLFAKPTDAKSFCQKLLGGSGG
jgi:EAL domain-containing protein (putative c-di-GMP-specific phosphodiesterase class I)/FixJ family two-component response regulator